VTRQLLCFLILAADLNMGAASTPADEPRVSREVAIIDFNWGSAKANPAPPATPNIQPVATLDTRPASGQASQSADSLNRTSPAVGIPSAGIILAEAAEPKKASPRPSYFQYTVKLKNLNQHAIRFVVWDYVFKDPVSREEFGRVRFRSETLIKPGQTKQIHGYTRMPPTRVVSVRALQKKGKAAGESVEIVRVLYANPVAQQ
jgi:hypothetical protein